MKTCLALLVTLLAGIRCDNVRDHHYHDGTLALNDDAPVNDDDTSVTYADPFFTDDDSLSVTDDYAFITSDDTYGNTFVTDDDTFITDDNTYGDTFVTDDATFTTDDDTFTTDDDTFVTDDDTFITHDDTYDDTFIADDDTYGDTFVTDDDTFMTDDSVEYSGSYSTRGSQEDDNSMTPVTPDNDGNDGAGDDAPSGIIIGGAVGGVVFLGALMVWA